MTRYIFVPQAQWLGGYGSQSGDKLFRYIKLNLYIYKW